MTKMQKRTLRISIVLAAILAVSPAAGAMHIMEGYLSPLFCIAWGVVCLPFFFFVLYEMKKVFAENKKAVTILAMAGAYIFVLSALKIPSVTGSCSHMTGAGLAAILFGPSITGILGSIVLIFQAVLLAHGGLTTLGANTFSMAIAGPAVAYGIWLVCRKFNINKRAGIFVAAAVGDLGTYCITSFQLAFAYPDPNGGVLASAAKFLGVFAPTQLPLAVAEGALTVMIMVALENYAAQELKAIRYEK